MASPSPLPPPGSSISDGAGDPGTEPNAAGADASLPLSRLEGAINRARQAQPAQGFEASLADDVSLLGRVYGRLIWRRAAMFRRNELNDDERAALDRWTG